VRAAHVDQRGGAADVDHLDRLPDDRRGHAGHRGAEEHALVRVRGQVIEERHAERLLRL
jgi:hypothetical protein